MQITKISIHQSYTFNLGDYSNIKLAISIEAELGEGNDFEQICQELQTLAREKVHEEIDHELERMGRTPEFYDGPLYSAIKCGDEKIILIVSESQRADLPGYWPRLPTLRGRHRLERIKAICQEDPLGYQIIDVSDGDFTNIPIVELFTIFRVNANKIEGKYLVIVSGRCSYSDLPNSWTSNIWYISSSHDARIEKNLLADAQKEATDKGFTMINCLDGDLSKLPELKLKDYVDVEDYSDMDYDDDNEDEEDY